MYREIYNTFLAIYACFELQYLMSTLFLKFIPSMESFKSWLFGKTLYIRAFIYAIRITLFPPIQGSIEHSRYRSTITYHERDAHNNLVTKTLILPNNTVPYTWEKVYAEFEAEEEFSSTEESHEDDDEKIEERRREKELLDDISLGPIWVDVTEDIEKVCGPKKDFYLVLITTSTINESWIKLKFVGKDTTKYAIFEKDDVIDPKLIRNL